MNMDDIGWKFWAAFVGLTLAAGVAMMVCFAIFGAMWASWGLLGAFIVFGLVLLGIAWIHDTRQRRRMTA